MPAKYDGVAILEPNSEPVWISVRVIIRIITERYFCHHPLTTLILFCFFAFYSINGAMYTILEFNTLKGNHTFPSGPGNTQKTCPGD